jgi:hypothetical protein
MSASFPVTDRRQPWQLRDAYRWICDESCVDPRFHTRLVIPRGWQPDQFPAHAPSRRRPLSGLSIWRSGEEPRALVRVEGVRLEREVSPAAWLEETLRAGGQEILHARRFPSLGGEQLDVLVRGDGELGEGSISRWVALKDSTPDGAGTLFVLSAHARADVYEEVALDLMWAVQGFAIASPSRFPYAERLRSHMAGAPGDFVFYYPYSWELTTTHASSSLSGLHVAEIQNNLRDAPLGRVTFMCTGAAEHPTQLLEPYLTSLRSRGLSPRVEELSPIPAFGGLERCWATTGSARVHDADSQPPKPPFDLRVAIGTREDAWFAFGMWSLNREVLPVVGDTNHRGLEIMLHTMKTARATLSEAPPE